MLSKQWDSGDSRVIDPSRPVVSKVMKCPHPVHPSWMSRLRLMCLKRFALLVQSKCLELCFLFTENNNSKQEVEHSCSVSQNEGGGQKQPLSRNIHTHAQQQVRGQ